MQSLRLVGNKDFAVALEPKHFGKLMGEADGDSATRTWHPLKLADFDWVGVHSIASMKAKFAEIIVALASVPGDPSDPAVIAKARQILGSHIGKSKS